MNKLETAVHEARGADEDVIDQLESGPEGETMGALAQSTVIKTLRVSLVS